MSQHRPAGPFAALGLPARAGLTDDDVRSAWRRIAAATHPDRADGGDPGRFASAAAAYSLLRTASGRGEALADLAGPGTASAGIRDPGRPAGRARRWGRSAGAAAALGRRVRGGRPARLGLRVAAAAAVSLGVIMAAGGRPAVPAVITGTLTWLVLTARHDLAPPR
jgi:hypothetical protein